MLFLLMNDAECYAVNCLDKAMEGVNNGYRLYGFADSEEALNILVKKLTGEEI